MGWLDGLFGGKKAAPETAALPFTPENFYELDAGLEDGGY